MSFFTTSHYENYIPFAPNDIFSASKYAVIQHLISPIRIARNL